MILRYRADLRPITSHVLYFSLLAVSFALVPLTTWWAIPTFLGLTLLAFQGAVQTHNSVHAPIFKRRWANKVYQVVLTLVYGHPVSSYVPGHNLSHHKYTQSQRDLMRTTKAQFSHNLVNLFLFMPMTAPGIMVADAAYTKAMKERHPRWYKQMRAELIILWIVQIALLVIDWRKAIVFWLVPHLIAQWAIVTMNLLQHDGCDENSAYDHSRNFVGRTINWWTFNNGYHTIHHMKPGLHWSLTPAAHAELVAPHIHPNLDQPSLFLYLWRTYFLNNRLTYLGEPIKAVGPGLDEEWIPHPRETFADLGAEGLEGLNSELNDMVAHNVG